MTVNDCLEDVKKESWWGSSDEGHQSWWGSSDEPHHILCIIISTYLYIYMSTYLCSFAILAWRLSRLRLEKADEVLRILKTEMLTDLRDG